MQKKKKDNQSSQIKLQLKLWMVPNDHNFKYKMSFKCKSNINSKALI